jgi:hypothetical protein
LAGLYFTEMDPVEEKLYEIIAQEIAEKRMKGGLYAKAFADASGDKDKALALYIKLRFQDLQRELAADEAAVRAASAAAEAEERARNMKDRLCRCLHRDSEHPFAKKGAPCTKCACSNFRAL